MRGDHQWIYPDDRMICWAGLEVWVGVQQTEQQEVGSFQCPHLYDPQPDTEAHRASVRLIKISEQKLDKTARGCIGNFGIPQDCLR